METLERLKAIVKTIKPNVEIESVTLETRLQQDLNIDSLSMILLALAIEKEFKFHFEAVNSFNTVGDVVKYIESATHTPFDNSPAPAY